jgi:hypothetical protein
MNKENREPLRKRGLPNPQLVGLLMGAVALVAPFLFSYHPSYRFPELHIGALMWTLSFYATEWHFIVNNLLDPFLHIDPTDLFGIWIIGTRMLFAHQTMRYLQGKTTRKRLLILGIIAELPMAPFLLMNILQFVILTTMNPGGDFTLSLFSLIPIPCMLIFGILLLRYFPAPDESDWDLKRETKKWWLKTGSDSAKVEEDKLAHATNEFDN